MGFIAGAAGAGAAVRQTEGGTPARCVQRAPTRTAKLAPTIKRLRASGATTLRAIAAALNKRNIPTASGRGEWQSAQVWRVLARL
jgi:hypothetical protein